MSDEDTQFTSMLVGLIADMDPDDENQFTKDGLPSTRYLSDQAGRNVSKTERDAAWDAFGAQSGSAVSGPASERDADMLGDSEVEIDGIVYKKSELRPKGFLRIDNIDVSRRWIHTESGVKFYEDVPEVHARKLPVHPFLR